MAALRAVGARRLPVRLRSSLSVSGAKFSAVTFGIGTGTGQMSEEESGMDNVASGVNGIGCIGLMKWRLGLTKVEGLSLGRQ